MSKKMHSVVIPFQGFYQTMHMDAFDGAEEMMLEGSDAELEVDWKKAHEAYAKKYLDYFNDQVSMGFKFEFDSLVSPREYNFANDTLYANIDTDGLMRLLLEVDSVMFAMRAKENFTSYDGFASFYSNDPKNWGPISEWDHNQIGTLLDAHVEYLGFEEESLDSEIIYELFSEFGKEVYGNSEHTMLAKLDVVKDYGVEVILYRGETKGKYTFVLNVHGEMMLCKEDQFKPSASAVEMKDIMAELLWWLTMNWTDSGAEENLSDEHEQWATEWSAQELNMYATIMTENFEESSCDDQLSTINFFKDHLTVY